MKGTINMADSKINELINHGKQSGKLTTKEITDVLEELDFDADEINKLYDDFEREDSKSSLSVKSSALSRSSSAEKSSTISILLLSKSS